MDNEFLTEYVYNNERIKDGFKDGVLDFKTEVALRGDIALCANKGNHKFDKLVYLFELLMNIPKELYSCAVEISKEYFNETDVNKLSMHVVSRTPIYYLYYDKVLADLNAMQIPRETKKSIFCRYIEDMYEKDTFIAKSLLEATLDSSYTYLHDIARIYLREVNKDLEGHEVPEKTEQEKKNEFLLVIRLINDFQISKSPTLTKEKESELGQFLNRFALSDDSSTGTERAIKSFVSFLGSKGVDVSVEEQTFDDNGEMIDIDDLEELNDNIENVSKSMEELSESIKDVEDILKSLGVKPTNKDTKNIENIVKSFDVETEERPTVCKKVVCGKNVQIVKKNKHKQFRVVKINRFTGAECDWSEYFDTIEEAQQWKENYINKFPQLVEKFVFNIEVTGWKE